MLLEIDQGYPMKLFRLLSPTLLALIMCIGVTAGSMYVTVTTASLNIPAPKIEGDVPSDAQLVSVNSADAALAASSIELSADGTLNGRLSGIETLTGELTAAADIQVSVISVDGTVHEGVTSEDGTFEIAGLNAGAYTVLAAGPLGNLSYGIRLMTGYDAVAATSAYVTVSKTLDLQLDSALAPMRDNAALNRILESTEVQPVDSIMMDDAQVSRKDHVSAETLRTSTAMSGGTHVGHDQLVLNDDGSLDGRVSLLDPTTGQLAKVNDLQVHFIVDNTVVARTRVRPDGTFTQHNLVPDIYTMVVAGSDAAAYIGVDIIGGLASQQQNSKYLPTAARAAQQGTTIGAVQGSAAGATPPVFMGGPTSDDDLGGPVLFDDGGFYGGGGGGGFTGGGGGGFGGGGFGLLELGLIGGLAAALANDDDGAASPAN